MSLERYRQAPGLKLHPSVRAECLIVFTPRTGQMHWLNTPSWILFDLCIGRTEAALRDEYARAIGQPIAEARWARFRASLHSMVSHGLVEAVESNEKTERNIDHADLEL